MAVRCSKARMLGVCCATACTRIRGRRQPHVLCSRTALLRAAWRSIAFKMALSPECCILNPQQGRRRTRRREYVQRVRARVGNASLPAVLCAGFFAIGARVFEQGFDRKNARKPPNWGRRCAAAALLAALNCDCVGELTAQCGILQGPADGTRVPPSKLLSLGGIAEGAVGGSGDQICSASHSRAPGGVVGRAAGQGLGAQG